MASGSSIWQGSSNATFSYHERFQRKIVSAKVIFKLGKPRISFIIGCCIGPRNECDVRLKFIINTS